jgi:hypothetical protein
MNSTSPRPVYHYTDTAWLQQQPSASLNPGQTESLDVLLRRTREDEQ